MMITIRHILNDGSEVEDIEGRVIKVNEFTYLYEVINRIVQKEEQHAAI